MRTNLRYDKLDKLRAAIAEIGKEPEKVEAEEAPQEVVAEPEAKEVQL